MLSFRDWNIAKKLTSAMIIVAVAMIAVASMALVSKRQSMMTEKELAMRHQVEGVMAILEGYYAQQQSGKLSEAEARQAAYALLSKSRYDKTNYFIISDATTGVMQMHPYRPDLAGAPIDPATSTGKALTGIANAAASDPDGNFVRYQTVKPGQPPKSPEYPKLTFAKRFPPWNLVVSTGIYTDDVDNAFYADAAKFGAVVLAVVGLLGLLFYLIGRSISRPIARATEAAEAMALGKFADVVATDSKDEAGRLLRSMNTAGSALKKYVAAQEAMAAEHDRGAIDFRIDDSQFPGTYGLMAKKVNDLVASANQITLRVVDVVKAYANGDFSRDMDRLPGRKAEITAAMDGVKASFKAISDQVNKLAASAAQGDFTMRGDAMRFDHEFRTMIEALNRLMETSDVGLEEVARVLGAVAVGDLTESMRGEYQGTFARLKEDTNRTVTNLQDIIREIRVATDSINTAAKEIAAGNMDLSARTEQQAASLEETASSMEELSSTVKNNSENARNANDLAVSTSTVVKKSGETVSAVVSTMHEISSSSTKIAAIISVIDGIAFQTNILALNAAVEAARAGEQGRGFAVVASEVRTLAQRSADAAKEIKQLIQMSVDTVESGSALVDIAGRGMQELVGSVDKVRAIMGEITQAGIEQAEGIQQVSQAVSKMDQTTQQNAALVEEAAAAAQSLEEQARALSEAVAKFRTSDAGQRPPLYEVPKIEKPAAPKAPPRVTASPEVASPSAKKPRAKPFIPKGAAEAESEAWEEF